ALTMQAELVLLAIQRPEEGDRLGVPLAARRTEVAADAWLRAAEAKRRDGDVAGAAALLDGAIGQLGGNSTLLSARLATAEAAGDTATADRMAQMLLELGIGGRSGASLWMRVAEAAANRDDAGGALPALTKALEAAPACIPARALQIDLLGNTSD